MKDFGYIIQDELGLHARPAGMLVKEAKATGCTVKIAGNMKEVDATRLMGVMGLGIKQGQGVLVTVEGENSKQEEDATNQLKVFFYKNL